MGQVQAPDGARLADRVSGRAPAFASSRWPRASAAERIGLAGLAVFLAVALGLGMVLHPSPTGTGTHTVLGLPPCGMLLVTGHPCPTCGVTTSYVLAAHGQFREALVTQPFGLIVFALVVAGLALSVALAAAGRSGLVLMTGGRVVAVVVALVVAALASWGYKWAAM